MSAFTSYHLIVPHPPKVWRQCEERGCRKQARWICYPHGDLAQGKGLCDKHKKEAEKEQKEQMN